MELPGEAKKPQVRHILVPGRPSRMWPEVITGLTRQQGDDTCYFGSVRGKLISKQLKVYVALVQKLMGGLGVTSILWIQWEIEAAISHSNKRQSSNSSRQLGYIVLEHPEQLLLTGS